MDAYQKNSSLLIGLLLFSAVLAVGCEEAFEPMQKNDKFPFSIHGYLDASADRQWIRVTAVRDSLFMNDPKSSIDAIVTLEDLESGETSIFKDSLYIFAGDNHAFNFWSDMEIEPEKTYRLTAERSDGATSSATVTIPSDFPEPNIRSGGNGSFDIVDVNEVEHLADVKVAYYVDSDAGANIHTYHHIADTTKRFTPSIPNHKVEINISDHMEELGNTYFFAGYTVTKRELIVSSAGPDWIYPVTNDENLISLPEGTSNIKNGTGYFIGVINKTLPYDEGLEGFGSSGVRNR